MINSGFFIIRSIKYFNCLCLLRQAPKRNPGQKTEAVLFFNTFLLSQIGE